MENLWIHLCCSSDLLHGKSDLKQELFVAGACDKSPRAQQTLPNSKYLVKLVEMAGANPVSRLRFGLA